MNTCRCKDDKEESDAEKYFVCDRAASQRLQQVILAALHNVGDFDDDAVIADDDIEGERPSPQGLGPQWEAGASGKFETFLCPPSLAEGSLTFLKAEDSLKLRIH